MRADREGAATGDGIAVGGRGHGRLLSNLDDTPLALSWRLRQRNPAQGYFDCLRLVSVLEGLAHSSRPTIDDADRTMNWRPHMSTQGRHGDDEQVYKRGIEDFWVSCVGSPSRIKKYDVTQKNHCRKIPDTDM